MHTESPPILHTVDMTWPDFCQAYQAAQPTRDIMFAKAEKDFRQHCNPTSWRKLPKECSRASPLYWPTAMLAPTKPGGDLAICDAASSGA
jgi:hypothetical protein